MLYIKNFYTKNLLSKMQHFLRHIRVQQRLIQQLIAADSDKIINFFKPCWDKNYNNTTQNGPRIPITNLPK